MNKIRCTISYIKHGRLSGSAMFMPHSNFDITGQESSPQGLTVETLNP